MANWRLRMPANGSNPNAPLSRAASEQAEFTNFLTNVVQVAFEEISARVEANGRATAIHMATSGISLTVSYNGIDEIYYHIYRYALPNRIFPYVEVKYKERGSRNFRLNRTGSALIDFNKTNITLSEITKEHVIASFDKYYNDILSAIAEAQASEAAERDGYTNYDKKAEQE